MKLEVGMYVRTNLGIAKIISSEKKHLGIEFLLDKEIIDTHEDYYTNCMYDYKFYLTQIIKTSYNIIDLIEVGDYVNGSRVMKTNCKLEYIDDDSDTGVNEVYDGLELENGWIYFEHEINSIVTHEQMEIMSYKVEG